MPGEGPYYQKKVQKGGETLASFLSDRAPWEKKKKKEATMALRPQIKTQGGEPSLKGPDAIMLREEKEE